MLADVMRRAGKAGTDEYDVHLIAVRTNDVRTVTVSDDGGITWQDLFTFPDTTQFAYESLLSNVPAYNPVTERYAGVVLGYRSSQNRTKTYVYFCDPDGGNLVLNETQDFETHISNLIGSGSVVYERLNAVWQIKSGRHGHGGLVHKVVGHDEVVPSGSASPSSSTIVASRFFRDYRGDKVTGFSGGSFGAGSFETSVDGFSTREIAQWSLNTQTQVNNVTFSPALDRWVLTSGTTSSGRVDIRTAPGLTPDSLPSVRHIGSSHYLNSAAVVWCKNHFLFIHPRGGSNGQPLVSVSDDGTTWDDIPSNFPTDRFVHPDNLIYLPGIDCVYALRGTNHSYRSFDGGETFSENMPVNDIRFIDVSIPH